MDYFLCFKNKNMLKIVLSKIFWNVGRSLLRDFAWDLVANLEDVLNFSLKWVEICNVPPYLWFLLLHVFLIMVRRFQKEPLHFTIEHPSSPKGKPHEVWKHQQ